MPGNTAAAVTDGAARPRPSYLRPLGKPPARATRDDQDDLHDHDRSDDRLSSSSSVPLPLAPPLLSSSDARLAKWLWTYAEQLTPKDNKRHAVHYHLNAWTPNRRPGFHGARIFVLKYGRAAILQAIHELIYWDVDETGHWRRYWSDSIVSPARRLNALVRDMHTLRARQDRRAE